LHLRVLRPKRPQPVANLLIQTADVPAQMPIDELRAVRESVHNVEPYGVTREYARDHAAAGRADVNCGKDSGSHVLSEKRAGDPGIDGHEEAGRMAELVRRDRRDAAGDVLWQHLALQERALRVVRAQLFL